MTAILGFILAQPLSENSLAERSNLLAHLDELLGLEESFWRVKSHLLWLRDGDRNTKFFHQKANNWRIRNHIKGIINARGLWVKDDKGIKDTILNYYSDLFTSLPTHNPDLVLSPKFRPL